MSPLLATDRQSSREWQRRLVKNDVIMRKASLLQDCDSDHIPSVFGLVIGLLAEVLINLCLYSTCKKIHRAKL